jgi:hypothetical protein
MTKRIAPSALWVVQQLVIQLLIERREGVAYLDHDCDEWAFFVLPDDLLVVGQQLGLQNPRVKVSP